MDTRHSQDPEHKTLVIVGAGFGGLRLARALSRAPLNLILVDRRNHHLFQPLLYQVATAGLAPSEIAHPVRAILRGQRNLEFRLAEVQGVDLAARRIQTSTGALEYDYLALAIGSQTSYFDLQNVARHSFGLKDIDEASAIRDHVLRMFELAAQESDPARRRAMLTFAVVGGGPSGVESAGALAELTRLVLVKDFPSIDPKDVRVLLLEATQTILGAFPSDLREAAAETLWRKHVEVRFGVAASDYDGERITLQGGEVIPALTLIWAAGVRAESLADRLGVSQGKMGRVIVLPTLQIPGYPEVFMIGDAAYLEDDGKPLPMMAPVAMQQAETAAANLLKLMTGEPLQPFVFKDPGSLATIGRNAAVARLGKLHFHGFLAWILWLVVHLLQLIGFRNRLLVLINWAWDYFFYDRAVRIIEKKQ